MKVKLNAEITAIATHANRRDNKKSRTICTRFVYPYQITRINYELLNCLPIEKQIALLNEEYRLFLTNSQFDSVFVDPAVILQPTDESIHQTRHQTNIFEHPNFTGHSIERFQWALQEQRVGPQLLTSISIVSISIFSQVYRFSINDAITQKRIIKYFSLDGVICSPWYALQILVWSRSMWYLTNTTTLLTAHILYLSSIQAHEIKMKFRDILLTSKVSLLTGFNVTDER